MLFFVVWWHSALLVLFGITFVASVIKEADSMAAVTFFILLAICQWLIGFDIWQLVLGNYLFVFSYFALYILTGVIWSIFKWYRFLKEEHKKYVKKKISFLKEYDIPIDGEPLEIPDDLKTEWAFRILHMADSYK